MLEESMVEHIAAMRNQYAQTQLLHLRKIVCNTSLKAWTSFVKKSTYKKEKQPLEYSYRVHQSQSLQDMSGQFTLFASAIACQQLYILSAQVIKIGWRDFSMLLDTQKSTNDITLIFDLTPTWDERKGGSLVIVDDDTTPVETTYGSCTLFTHKRYFFQYVNHYARKAEKAYVVVTFGKK